jgi:predicted dehydrogenase
VEPYTDRALLYSELEQSGLPVFPQLNQLFDAGISPDLVVISSPIQEHVSQSCLALEHGCHVLCDKPLGATVQDANQLIAAEKAAGRIVGIGYQWSYSSAIQKLKEEIQSGRWGRPLRFKALCLWPRERAYYLRNDWAGRIRDAQGRWVLDSPANNAMAHFLHNLLYLLGAETHLSAKPVSVTAEAYRVFPIENYDSVACRILTDEGVELLFYASHAVPAAQGPTFQLAFKDMQVNCGSQNQEILCSDRQGRTISLGSPESDSQFNKLLESIKMAAQGEVNKAVCGPVAARSQTLCVNGIQESVGDPLDLSRSQVRREESGRIWIQGLAEAFQEAFQLDILPSELGLSWTQQGKSVDLREYAFYPGGKVPDEQ